MDRQWFCQTFLCQKNFYYKKKIKNAYAHLTGLGQFNFYVNGHKVGNHQLDPAWTDYYKQLSYLTFEFSQLLKRGGNVLAISVGNGWYIGDYQGDSRHFYTRDKGYQAFASQLAMIMEIKIEYQDGSSEKLFSNKSWKTRKSATNTANVYGSEDFDARKYPTGWNNTNFIADNWSDAVIVKAPAGKLSPQQQPPVIIKEEFTAREITELEKGKVIFDLGQNMSAVFEICVRGAAGSRISLKPGEKLNPDGTISQTTNTVCHYTLMGGGEIEVWRPEFSYTGARWVQIEGVSRQPADDSLPYIADLKGYFISSAAEDVGQFTASDQRYQQIGGLILKAMESNLNHIHSDCPTIEKLGWLEASHLMAPSLMFNKNMSGLLAKIARDIREAQAENGFVPTVAPRYVNFEGYFGDSPVWGSTAVILPYLHYQFYGDLQIIMDNYQTGSNYVSYLKSRENAAGLLDFGLGDWGIEQNKGESVENIDTAIYYWDLLILQEFAQILERKKDQAYFAREAERVLRNYNSKMLLLNSRTGLYCYQAFDTPHSLKITQANQAIPLYLGMVPPDKEADVYHSFLNTVKEQQFKTGEIGLRFVIQTLASYGHNDIIQEMMMQLAHPSYYRFVEQGETTLPEFWRDDARSRNHDMMGHIMEWFYNSVAGISALEPGFKEIKIAPQVPAGLSSFAAKYNSIKGEIISNWSYHKDKQTRKKRFLLQVKIPVNTKAVIHIPVFDIKNPLLKEGDVVLYQDHYTTANLNSEGISCKGLKEKFNYQQYLLLIIDSGNYEFELN